MRLRKITWKPDPINTLVAMRSERLACLRWLEFNDAGVVPSGRHQWSVVWPENQPAFTADYVDI